MLLHKATALAAALSIFGFSVTWMPLHNANAVGAALSSSVT